MQKTQIDDRDRAILSALQTEGAMSNADLAAKVNLSPSACLRRVGLLKEGGLISGTHAVLDQKLAGYEGTAYVFITLAGQEREQLAAFEAKVKTTMQIQECYLLAGQSDYLLRVVFHDMADLERLHTDVLTRLPHVNRVQSTLTLRTVKRTTRVPLR